MKTTRRGFWAILSGMIGIAATQKHQSVASPPILMPSVWYYVGGSLDGGTGTITVSDVNVPHELHNVWYTQSNTQWSFTK